MRIITKSISIVGREFINNTVTTTLQDVDTVQTSDFSTVLPWSIALIAIVVIVVGTTSYFATYSTGGRNVTDDSSNSIPTQLRDNICGTPANAHASSPINPMDDTTRNGSPIEFRRSNGDDSCASVSSATQIDFDTFV